MKGMEWSVLIVWMLVWSMQSGATFDIVQDPAAEFVAALQQLMVLHVGACVGYVQALKQCVAYICFIRSVNCLLRLVQALHHPWRGPGGGCFATSQIHSAHALLCKSIP
jgi:hypothetical protein